MRSTIFLSALAALPTTGVRAQTPDRVQQAESYQRRQEAEQLLPPITEESAPELFVGEFKDVGPQSILRIKPRRTLFEAGVDSELYYTSNVFLEEEANGVDLTDTTVLVNTVHLDLAPLPYVVGPGRLEPRVGFRYTWFNYGIGDNRGQLNDFDFDEQTAYLQLRYQLRGGWVFDLGFEWSNLTDHEPNYFDRFYTEYVPRWAVARQIALTESRYFTFGYEGAYRFSDTDDAPDSKVNDRTDQVLFARYTHGFTPRLILQPYYRFQYSRYTQNDGRDDYTQTTGCSVYYAIASWLSVRVFGTYERRDSDDRLVPDYHKYDGGLGLSLIGRF
jgi:hypothetical protein